MVHALHPCQCWCSLWAFRLLLEALLGGTKCKKSLGLDLQGGPDYKQLMRDAEVERDRERSEAAEHQRMLQVSRFCPGYRPCMHTCLVMTSLVIQAMPCL